MTSGFARMFRFRSRAMPVWGLLAMMLASLGSGALEAVAQESSPAETQGAFLTLTSPITDDTIAQVRRLGLQLQDSALRDNRRTCLVLEFTPGQSQFHHVYALADFLSSPSLSNVLTVAWVPETVSGHNVLPVLACNEIVLTAEARLGDIGLGQPLPQDQQTIVQEIVSRRRNPLVGTALAKAMADPASTLLQLSVETADGGRERRLATPDEASRLQASGVTVPESRTLKEPGTPGLFSGAQARAGDFLVRHIASSRREVADLYKLPAEAARQSQPSLAAHNVSIIEISGSIDSVLESFLVRQMQKAVAGGADLILFEIHSPGGHLNEVQTLALAITRLSDSRVRTAAWVPEIATGEAALIALACDEIYLAPKARLGAVTKRRNFDLRQAERDEEERVFLQETLQELARLKHRPAAVLLAMADPNVRIFQATNKQTGVVTYLTEQELEQQAEDWIRGPFVAESGQGVLEVSGDRARELLVAEPIVQGFEEVKERLGLPPDARPRRIEKNWVDDLVFVLNRPVVTGLLFAVAMICIYLELHFTSGFLGIISVVCFALFFWSRFLGGTAGGLEVLLFIIGLGCLAAEIFVIPGFGVFGLSGGLLVVLSLVMASQTFGSVEPGRDMTQAMNTMKTLSAAIVSLIVVAMLLNRFLPRMPFLNEMVLGAPGGHGSEAGGEPRLRPEVLNGTHSLVGTVGAAATSLRPAGKARIQGELVNVISNGPFIVEGTPVEVVSVSGNHVVVREATS